LNQAIVLFAHGSRDAAWARPFEALHALVAEALPGREVRLAYLEHMKPSLGAALDELAALGVTSVRVVPLFFGLGGHLRQDLPRLVAEARAKLDVVIDAPIGEQVSVIRAIAAAIASGKD
jgi:sirohydrochlorin cobaltochelatase